MSPSRRSLLPALDGLLLVATLAAALAVVVTFLAAVTGRTLNDFPIGLSGAHEAAGLPAGVTLHGVTAEVTARVGLGSRLAWWAVGEGAGVLILAGAWTLRAIVGAARRGDPFVAANVRRLRQLGGVTLAYGALNALRPFVARLIQDDLGVGRPPLEVPGAPLIFAVLLYALAQIWQHAVDLSVDSELTV